MSGAATVTVTSSRLLPPGPTTVWNPGVAGGHPHPEPRCAPTRRRRDLRQRQPPTRPPGSRRRSTPARRTGGAALRRRPSPSTAGTTSSSTRESPCAARVPDADHPPEDRRRQARAGGDRSQSLAADHHRAGPLDSNGTETSHQPHRRRGQGRVPRSRWPAPAGSAPGRSSCSTSCPAPAGSPIPRDVDRSGPRPTSGWCGSGTTQRQGTDDPFPDAFSWFSRTDRPTNEIKQIASVSGNTVTFTTPVHISYRTSHTAQLSTLRRDLHPGRRGRGPEGHRRRQREHPLPVGRATAGRSGSTTPCGTTRGSRWSARSG